MTARDVADGVGHGEHGQAEGERDAKQANADLREGCRDDRAAAAREGEPESADGLGEALTKVHGDPLARRRM
jgi:hypothetical protein